MSNSSPKSLYERFVDKYCCMKGYTGVQLYLNKSLLLIQDNSGSLADNNPDIKKLYDEFNNWKVMQKLNTIQSFLKSDD